MRHVEFRLYGQKARQIQGVTRSAIPTRKNSVKCPIALVYVQSFEKSGKNSDACVLCSLRKSLLDIKSDKNRNSSSQDTGLQIICDDYFFQSQ